MNFGRQLILVACLGCLVFLPIAAKAQFVFDENPLVGKQAPDFSLKTVAGESVSLNQLRGNHSAMIVFWATWCPSCRGELKTLKGLEDLLEKSGTKVILVNLEENPRLVKAYADKLKIPYMIMLDEDSQVAEQYSIIGLPTIFFVNPQGVVVAMEYGLPDHFVAKLNAQVKKKS